MKTIGFIGLGRMGKNMVLNLSSKKFKVVVFNRSPEPTKEISARKNVVPAFSLKELAEKLPKPKIIWMMIKVGVPISNTIRNLLPYLNKGDILIDGGNSFFKDSQMRYKFLKSKGINFIDCGTSGGVEGAKNGASLMVGGDKEAFKKAEQIFKALSTKNGYAHLGESGAGHLTKLIHNAIEYGVMGSMAEGFASLEKFKKQLNLDINKTAQVYSNGSIISGTLMSHLYTAIKKPNYLNQISNKVPKGETEDEIKKLEKLVKIPTIKKARLQRVKSRLKTNTYGKFISALRNQFGQHSFIKNEKNNT